VEVANDRHIHSGIGHAARDFGDGGSGFIIVDRHADELRALTSEGYDLLSGGSRVGRVGVGHRLNDHGVAAPHRHPANDGGYRGPADSERHARKL
jgi:hypothetical protein